MEAVTMEGREGSESAGGGGSYTLKPRRINNEDILFCIDIDAESTVEMKTTGSTVGPLTRLDSIKQAILFFINAKLSINPDHRFAFVSLAKHTSWLQKEFSNDVESAVSTLGKLSASSSSPEADLTQLFWVAAHEAKKSHSENRIFRVILIYCRSSVRPKHQWPVNQKLFTFDVMYLHDKPGPDNCPQDVYDALVDTLEHVSEYEGYIYETGQGLRVLLRKMTLLLAHPQQRCPQDNMGIPKSLTKRSTAADSSNGEESVNTLSQ